MVAPQTNAPRASAELPAKEPEARASSESSSASPRPGGITPWLPLLANLIVLPLLAYGATRFVLLPKLEHDISRLTGGHAPAKGEATLEDKAAGTSASEGPPGKVKITTPLAGKILVNVAGTQGTRYLQVSMVLVGADPNMKVLVDKNDAQLRDAASSILSSKTIADLEKPGSRNLIRNELVSAFNTVLGNGLVKEIYLTDFAIQ